MKATVLTAVLLSLALGACADNSPGGKAAKARHESFEEMGEAFEDLTDELKKDAPDMAAIKASAVRIDTLAQQVPTWFPAGSGPQDGVSTEALAVAWTKPAEFRQAAERLGTAAAELRAAAESGDAAAIGAAVKSTGGACKNCHDQFREEI